jgi:Holliday junction resolvase RusA-like endonuclease
MEVSFFVPGKAIPQGSKRGFVVKTHAVTVDVNPESLGGWRSQVALGAIEASQGKELHGAIRLELLFTMKQPISVKRAYPSVKPDLDKLERAICDALTGSGIYHDDGQVVSKASDERYGDRPGVQITLREME